MLARPRSSWTAPLLTWYVVCGIWLNQAIAGKAVKVSWDPNKESDLSGYKIYYGTQSRQYTQVIDVGNVTEYRINNLEGGKVYYFVVTAYDTAGNESAPSEEVSAAIPADDVTPPYITNVQILARNSLLVVFSEKVTRASAENISNYEIIGGVRVKGALLKDDGASVNLITDDHQNGKTYILRVSGIQDLANPPNTIAPGSQWGYTYQASDFTETPPDTTAPFLLNVRVADGNKLEVMFNEKVLPISAENKANYTITGGINIGEASLQNDGRTVVLTTSMHKNGTTYILTVRNIADLAEPPNFMRSPIQWTYTYHAEDREPPRIVDGKLLDLTHLQIFFSEPVLPETAENTKNYNISDGIIINSANLQENQKEVILVTTPHQINRQYTLTVSGIKDQSPFQNVIPSGTKFYYMKQGEEPPPDAEKDNDDNRLVVQNLSPAEYRLATLQPGESYYIDRDFRLVSVPRRLTNLVWIKTAYRDRLNTSSDFLTFYLNQPAKLYIAYDVRAKAWPEWLKANFTRIPYTIEVSEPGRYLELWETTVQPGRITLGGNAAPGAENVQSMYVVILDVNPLEPKGDSQPKDYVLYQNYPNPFNPETEISFYLARPSYVELKIYNMRGQLVKTLVNGEQGRGLHRIRWNATNDAGVEVPSGTYFYVLDIKEVIKQGEFILTHSLNRQKKSMIFLR